MFCTEKLCETCVDWSRVHNKCMDAFHPNVNTETKSDGECPYYERRRERGSLQYCFSKIDERRILIEAEN